VFVGQMKESEEWLQKWVWTDLKTHVASSSFIADSC